jgi:hypothetical protein
MLKQRERCLEQYVLSFLAIKKTRYCRSFVDSFINVLT